jgi:hypothetical protein
LSVLTATEMSAAEYCRMYSSVQEELHMGTCGDERGGGVGSEEWGEEMGRLPGPTLEHICLPDCPHVPRRSVGV